MVVIWIPEIPTLLSAIYGTFIVGGGYLALFFRYKISEDESQFYSMKTFDKTVKSLILGAIGFILTLYVVQLDISKITDENQFIFYLIKTPSIFIIELVILIYLVILIKILENKLNKKDKIFEKLKENLNR